MPLAHSAQKRKKGAQGPGTGTPHLTQKWENIMRKCGKNMTEDGDPTFDTKMGEYNAETWKKTTQGRGQNEKGGPGTGAQICH